MLFLLLQLSGVSKKALSKDPSNSPHEGKAIRPLLTPLQRGEILAGGICLFTTPSLWRFLSPGDGGTEGGVKTIEGWEGSSGGKAGMGLYHLSFII